VISFSAARAIVRAASAVTVIVGDDALVDRLDAIEIGLGQFDRRNFLRAQFCDNATTSKSSSGLGLAIGHLGCGWILEDGQARLRAIRRPRALP